MHWKRFSLVKQMPSKGREELGELGKVTVSDSTLGSCKLPPLITE